ncbi:MAG TPA: metallophosphoesterase [Thermoanaerobaculia bacterium]|nr:metallophosphoesterase [Thermoanaerobaculia bacterium]
MRIALFLVIALLLFLPFNWLAYRQLVRIHPRRRRWILPALVLGNLMWPFFPLLRSFTDFARITRAIFGPLWFGWTVLTLLYSLLLFVVLLAWIPFHRRMTFARFARWPSRVFLVTGAIACVIGYYQAIVPLRVERVPIRIANLPAAADGMKIALLGDLHVGLFTRPSRLQTIFATTARLHPDVVLLAGDMIDDDPHFVPKLLAGTSALPPSTPVYGVLGNHEMYGDPLLAIERLEGSRIRLLMNEGTAMRGIWIAGVSDPAARDAAQQQPRLLPNLTRALHGRPAAMLPIVVAHQPKILDDALREHVPLVLTAHTHGGQFGIRPLGWSLAGVFLRYHMGLYAIGGTQLYINTGTGYWLFPFRLGMTPEITLIELQR